VLGHAHFKLRNVGHFVEVAKLDKRGNSCFFGAAGSSFSASGTASNKSITLLHGYEYQKTDFPFRQKESFLCWCGVDNLHTTTAQAKTAAKLKIYITLHHTSPCFV
jgi:hypothetical protein